MGFFLRRQLESIIMMTAVVNAEFTDKTGYENIEPVRLFRQGIWFCCCLILIFVRKRFQMQHVAQIKAKNFFSKLLFKYADMLLISTLLHRNVHVPC